MEVHHLVQEADGGTNKLDNAIPLCFDCHCDAGHYNSQHPKGSKFSINELVKARDDWYARVRNNSIPEKVEVSSDIQTSYYVLHSFEILQKTLSNDFSSVNRFRTRVYLVANAVSNFWQELLQNHKNDYGFSIDQRLMIELAQYGSIEEYLVTHRDASILDKSGVNRPYYEASRPISWSELEEQLSPNSFVKSFEKAGVESISIIKGVLHENGPSCSGDTPEYGYTEYVEIAPLSFVFLGITNVSSRPIKLDTLKTGSGSTRLPEFALLPMEMLMMPLATVTNLIGIDESVQPIIQREGERGESFSRIINASDFPLEKVSFIFQKIEPESLIYHDEFGEYELGVHQLNLSNLYSVNSYWQCGSCPHLFFEEDGAQFYQGELFLACNGQKVQEDFTIPKGVSAIIIRELEDEVTEIDLVLINGKVKLRNAQLNKGDTLKLPVQPFDAVKIIGKYIPDYPRKFDVNDLWKRNHLIELSNHINKN